MKTAKIAPYPRFSCVRSINKPNQLEIPRAAEFRIAQLKFSSKITVFSIGRRYHNFPNKPMKFDLIKVLDQFFHFVLGGNSQNKAFTRYDCSNCVLTFCTMRLFSESQKTSFPCEFAKVPDTIRKSIHCSIFVPILLLFSSEMFARLPVEVTPVTRVDVEFGRFPSIPLWLHGVSIDSLR